MTVMAPIGLRCGHTVPFQPQYAPVLGEWVWCRTCRSYTFVTSAPARYHITCQGCLYREAFSYALITAERAIARHRTKYPQHAIELWNGEVLEHVYDVVQETLPEPLDSDPDCPPY